MLAELPSRSISESSMEGWRRRADYVAGGSLERMVHENLREEDILGLTREGNDGWPAVEDPARSIVLRNLVTNVQGVVMLHNHLGSGTFGHVWECEVLGHIGHVAVKLLKPRANGAHTVREMETHAGLRHPNLVQLIQAVEGPPSAIIMELCAGGTLEQLIHNPEHRHGADYAALSVNTRLRAALDILACVEYLHGNNILHRDIKPSNCLLGSVFEAGATEIPLVKVADLGLARHEAEEMSQRVGTLRYMAPELMEGQDYSFPVDIYSCGMLLYELATGLLPFSTSGQRLQNDVAFVLAVASGTRPALDDDSLPPNAAREKLRSIIESMWQAEAVDRPTAAGLSDHLRSLMAAMP